MIDLLATVIDPETVISSFIGSGSALGITSLIIYRMVQNMKSGSPLGGMDLGNAEENLNDLDMDLDEIE